MKPTTKQKKKTTDAAIVSQLSAAGFSAAQVEALMALFKAA